MSFLASSNTLEQRAYDILTPHNALTKLNGHCHATGVEGSAFAILADNVAQLARLHYEPSFGDLPPQNLSVASVQKDNTTCTLMILVRTPSEQYKIVQVDVAANGGNWLGELVKKVNEQLVRLLAKTMSREV